jgi:hypothetical protein
LQGGYGGGLRGRFWFSGEGNPVLLKHAFLHASGCFMEPKTAQKGLKRRNPPSLHQWVIRFPV